MPFPAVSPVAGTSYPLFDDISDPGSIFSLTLDPCPLSSPPEMPDYKFFGPLFPESPGPRPLSTPETPGTPPLPTPESPGYLPSDDHLYCRPGVPPSILTLAIPRSHRRLHPAPLATEVSQASPHLGLVDPWT